MPREHSAAAADRTRIQHLAHWGDSVISICTAWPSRETRPKIVAEQTDLTAELSDRVTD
jgi:hypothetical protein